MTYTDATPETVEHLDRVDQILAEVKGDLRARQERGELPVLPPGEVERHFSAIVDAVDAGLTEEIDFDVDTLSALAGLPNWNPTDAEGRTAAIHRGSAPLRRVVGRLVRNQVSPFSTQAVALLRSLIARQDEQARFLTTAHLERLRLLEARVASLELHRHAEDAGSRSAPASDPAGD